jgi:hypothetical protein
MYYFISQRLSTYFTSGGHVTNLWIYGMQYVCMYKNGTTQSDLLMSSSLPSNKNKSNKERQYL